MDTHTVLTLLGGFLISTATHMAYSYYSKIIQLNKQYLEQIADKSNEIDRKYEELTQNLYARINNKHLENTLEIRNIMNEVDKKLAFTLSSVRGHTIAGNGTYKTFIGMTNEQDRNKLLLESCEGEVDEKFKQLLNDVLNKKERKNEDSEIVLKTIN